jgi:hypothetical protein
LSELTDRPLGPDATEALPFDDPKEGSEAASSAPPPARLPKRWWVIPVGLLGLLALVLLSVTLVNHERDSATKNRLVSTVEALEKASQGQTTDGFKNAVLQDYGNLLAYVGLVDGNTQLRPSDANDVSVFLCITGPSCDAAAIATRGPNDSCWYAAVALTPTAASDLRYPSGTIGVQYGVHRHSKSCTASDVTAGPHPAWHWQETVPSGV